MSTITMTSKGQITLPAATRVKRKLVKGAQMDGEETADGKVILTPKPQKTGDIRRLRGILKCDGPPASIEAMNASIGAALGFKYGDLADNILHELGQAIGCTKTVIFDKKFARLEDIELLA